jgi:hypothetical protein
MVLELAFLLVPKGANHLSEKLWTRVVSFLSQKDVASVAACCSRLHRVVATRRAVANARLKEKEVVPLHVVAGVVAVVVSPVVTPFHKPEVIAVVPEEPEQESKGIFASLRGGGKKNSSGGSGFSLRKPKKK